MIEKIAARPRLVFLTDGLGALLSAFLLGLVLVRLEGIFGIPAPTLYFLASWPVLFAAFDCYGYLKNLPNPAPFIRGIAIANLLYSCVSLGLAFYHIGVVTAYGWAYILGEVVLVAGLSTVELMVARKLAEKTAFPGVS